MSEYDEIYDREKRAYIANPDWDDVAYRCSKELPVLLGMIARGKGVLANDYLNVVMLEKAADLYADYVANKRSVYHA